MRKMRDSGVEWIGEIPENWKVDKVRHIFKQRNTKGNVYPVLLSATQLNGMCPQSELEGVVQVKNDTDLQLFKTIHKYDYVISLRSFQGGFEMSEYEGVCSPAYQVFYNIKPINYSYFKLLFKSLGFISQINALTVGIREGKNIKYETFSYMDLPNPPLFDQQNIATFLDTKCSEIDSLILLQETIISELQAYKQSVITEAVTKGLDKNVEMKDSGVEWIGKIPEHWDVCKLKFYAKSYTDKSINNDYIYIGLENILSNSSIYVPTNNEYDKSQSLFCKSGSVIFGKLRPYLAKVFLVNNDACCSSEFAVFHVMGSPEYFRYLLLSDWFIKIVDSSTYGTKMPRANIEYINNMYIIAPPLSEQQSIAAYLDKKCADIDSLITLKQQKIDELKEYKKSVIFEYVTGKKEVNLETIC